MIPRNPSLNPAIEKYQLNHVIRKKSEKNPIIRKEKDHQCH